MAFHNIKIFMILDVYKYLEYIEKNVKFLVYLSTYKRRVLKTIFWQGYE